MSLALRLGRYFRTKTSYIVAHYYQPYRTKFYYPLQVPQIVLVYIANNCQQVVVQFFRLVSLYHRIELALHDLLGQ